MPVEVPRPRLYLASRSPRRRELLAQIGVAFDTLVLRSPPRDVRELDETPLAGEDPIEYVQRVARRKAEHGWRIVEWRKLPPQAVLAADTTLVLGGELVGKPRDADDAGAFDGDNEVDLVVLEMVSDTLPGDHQIVLTELLAQQLPHLALSVVGEARVRGQSDGH